LITVVADCYLAGVSTRRMGKLVKTLGIHSLSKSQVSRMSAGLDEHVEEFRHRPLGDAGPFAFVATDALTMKVREGGRVINAVVLVATGVNATDAAKSSACGSRPARPARPGTPSSPTSSPAAWTGCAWSPATPTRAWWRPSQRTCPERSGNTAAPTTQRT
jgi:hypothetical protein